MKPIFSMRSNTIRLFLSSTFKDMQAERDHLVTVVYPELEERLAAINLYFFDVDLRWGVPLSAEGELEEPINSWDYCRRSIENTEPFFVGILGHRYGSIVDKNHLTDDEQVWGENLSITELEIQFAALGRSRLTRTCYFYFRDTFPPEDPPKEIWSIYVDEDGSARLEELKQEISANLLVRHYNCDWSGASFSNLTSFGEKILEDLWSDVIKDSRYVDQNLWSRVVRSSRKRKALQAPGTLVPPPQWQVLIKAVQEARSQVQVEANQLNLFCQERIRWFQGRHDQLRSLQDFIFQSLAHDDPRIRVIESEPGQGKTSVLAKTVDRFSGPDSVVIMLAHFAGATERSASEYDLLVRLNDFIDSLKLSFKRPIALRQDNFRRLRERVEHLFLYYVGEKPLVIIIDGVDQVYPASNFEWLQKVSSERVRVIISCASLPRDNNPQSGVLPNLQKRWPDFCFLSVPGLPEKEIEEVVYRFLQDYSKTLRFDYVRCISQLPKAQNPLYLLTFLRELRQLSGSDISQFAHELIQNAENNFPTTTDVFLHMLARLQVFGRVALQAWFRYLLISRSGLSAQHLAELLGRRFGDSGQRAAHRIRRACRSYLQRRGTQLDFFHSEFKNAANLAFPPTDPIQLHDQIADAFADLGLKGDSHADNEMIFHLVESGNWAAVLEALRDKSCLYRRVKESDGARKIVDDFAFAYKKANDESLNRESRQILDTLLDAMLADELHAAGLTLTNVNAWLAYKYPKMLRELVSRGMATDGQ